jgi:class II flagellar assembly regulator FliX
MRVFGPNGTTLGSRAPTARRISSGSFSVPEEAVAVSDSRTISAPMAPTNIDALLALQGIEDPTEKRKRSVQRGRGALDVLDDLKLSLLTGDIKASMVSRLRDAATQLKSSSGDPALDALLSQIELRVEVELAKAGQV